MPSLSGSETTRCGVFLPESRHFGESLPAKNRGLICSDYHDDEPQQEGIRTGYQARSPRQWVSYV